MHTKFITPVLAACLAGLAAAQTLPSFLKKTGSYTGQQLFGQAAYGDGEIHFDPAGQYLYAIEINNSHVARLTIVRTNGKITGFTSPTRVLTAVTTGWLDGGLTLSPIGTLIATGWKPTDLEQINFATKAQTLINLVTNAGLPGTSGACDWLPKTATSNPRFLVSVYDKGGIYEMPRTRLSNLTYSVGTAKLCMETPGQATGDNGVEGFALVPTGPFGNGKGLVYVNYDLGTIFLAALDPTTLNPFKTAKG